MGFVYLYEIEQRKLFNSLTIAIALSGEGCLMGTDGDDVTNVEYKPNQNRHYDSPLYNAYTLIKIF
jgi:hypothetical protein